MAHPLYDFVFAPSGTDDFDDRPHREVSQERSSPAAPSSDAELVARVRGGSEEAFGAIFRAQYPSLVAYAESYLGVGTDAEETVADLFEWIWSHHADWTVNASGIRAYLYRSVRNRVSNRARHRRRTEARHLRLAREGHEAIIPSAPTDVATQVAADEMTDAFTTALAVVLAKLTPGVREVVSLRANAELSFEEIAAITDTTVTAVRMQWSRGLKLLREELPRLLGEHRS
jgi:RNA polymerase sigma factor (sigma-70 family)